MNSTNQEKDQSNLIMFPKTVDYYQVKLTRMLETEKYHEAIELLQFLLQTKGNEREAYNEWESLLEWLQNQFSEYAEAPVSEAQENQNEADFLQDYVQGKLDKDDNYTERLFQILTGQVTLEKKLLVLEQMAFVTDKDMTKKVRHWLEQEESHPLVAFKALQSLKQQGETGVIHIHRDEELMILRIEDTPLEFTDYPEELQIVLDKVKEISEINHPALSYFAEQTWKELLSFTYGGSLYRQVLEYADENVDLCAAALHYISLELMEGPPNIKELLSWYGISEKSAKQWQQLCQTMRSYMSSSLPS